MAKYHIDKNGMPAQCHAGKRPCPLGGKHFETLAEANVYADYQLKSQFINIPDKESNDVPARTLDGFTLDQEMYHDKASTEYKETKLEKVGDMLTKAGYQSKRRGLESETFISFEYARDMQLDNAIVIGKNGQTYKLAGDNNLTPQEMNLYATAKKNVSDAIKKTGHNVDPIIKSVYYSNDGSKTVVQMGSPNMPDIAVIENGKTRLLEAKDLSTQGSQIDATTAEVGDHGLSTMNTDEMADDVKNNLKLAGFEKTIGTNYVLNGVNYHEGLQHFVSNQQKQGVSALTYIGRDKKVHEIDITKDASQVADKMTEHGIHATLIMRSNEISNKPSKNTINRWKKTRANKYFANGKYPSDRYVPLSAFNLKNTDQLSIMKNNLCMGEMQLPVKCNDIRDLRDLDKNMIVDMSKVKARQMTFTGHLFQDSKKEREVTYNDRTQ